MRAIILTLCLFIAPSGPVLSQLRPTSGVNQLNLPLRSTWNFSPVDDVRINRCLRTGRIVGALAGGTPGAAVLWFGTQGEMEGPYWKTLVTGIPGALCGAWVGARGTEWLTRKLLHARRGILGSALRGAYWGFLDGALTGIAATVPILGIGHLTGAIEFNRKIGLLEVVGLAAAGGALYGGIYGTTAGFVIGPGISIYMDF